MIGNSSCRGLGGACPRPVNVSTAVEKLAICGCDPRMDEASREVNIQAALEVARQSLDVATRAFEELARMLAPEEETVWRGCPPDGCGLMPCCGRAPFEIPRDDRFAEFPGQFTCKGVQRAQQT